MPDDLAARFAPVVRRLPLASLSREPMPPELLIDRTRELAVYYAPFDFTNVNAKIVLVGITPGGHRQTRLAWLELRRQLEQGAELPRALESVKKSASLGAPARNPVAVSWRRCVEAGGDASSAPAATDAAPSHASAAAGRAAPETTPSQRPPDGSASAAQCGSKLASPLYRLARCIPRANIALTLPLNLEQNPALAAAPSAMSS